ncbi:hypothetical protein GOBAR_AA29253 [Gossypium barbadense]|uniref:BHLH domain-containing protein n=1 Tax=Gossypium barbadense TaxID=3634 RepID=A0A2P5WK10_GOSBA|nr:hypothetical protein GOBAR_AA29253 [Gossypium barbadense]
MVCQAASQTRFRALKHENGIAGKPTIVVRVIACFQPMEDCQAEYFRHLLKPVTIEHCPSPGICSSWMVKTNNSWVFPQHSSWRLPELSCMSASLEPRQPECLPACINPSSHILSVSVSKLGSLVPGMNYGTHVLPANIAMPGSADISVLKAEQKYQPHGLLQQLYPSFPTSLPSRGSFLNEQQFMIANGHTGRAAANFVSGSFQKGLIIFDHSGSQTRLICGSFRSPHQHAATAITELASSLDIHEGLQAVKTNTLIPTPPALQEEYDENRLGVEGSEMHSPIRIKRSFQNQDHDNDVIEQVASSDGPNKRQKLLNGGHKQSIMVDAACSVKLEGSHEYDSDAESSYRGEILHTEQSMKDKIRLTLKILESIIPGTKGKDPLLVLDESVDYLKSLKLEAETLGVNHF